MGERKHSGKAVFDHSRFCISAFIIAILLFSFVLSPLNPGSAALAAPITGSGNGSEQKSVAKLVDYPVTINLLNSEGVVTAPGHYLGDAEIGRYQSDGHTPIRFAVRATLRDKNNTSVTLGVAAAEVSADDFLDGQASVTLHFTRGAYDSTEVSYDPSIHNLQLRLVHQANQYYFPAINWEALNPSGNDISDSAPVGYAFIAGSTDADAGVINLQATKPVTYYARVRFDDPDLTLTSEDGAYVRTRIQHTSGNDTWGKGQLIVDSSNTQSAVDPDTGKTYYYVDVPISEWYSDSNFTTTTDDSFTGNEKEVTNEIVGKTNGGSYVGAAVGAPVMDYTVESYPDILSTYTDAEKIAHGRITDDTDSSVTKVYDVLSLTKHEVQEADYSLEWILTDHNLITICDPNGDPYPVPVGGLAEMKPGDVLKAIHLMSGVLIRGELMGNMQFGDSEFLEESSYVGILPDNLGDEAGNNTRKHDPNPPVLYLGEGNTVIGYVVNGVDFTSQNGINHSANDNGLAFATSDFINWDTLSNTVNNSSVSLANSASRTIIVDNTDDPDVRLAGDTYVVTVRGETNVTLSNPNNVSYKVEFVNIAPAYLMDEHGHYIDENGVDIDAEVYAGTRMPVYNEELKATVVNILDTGTATAHVMLPGIYAINGYTQAADWLTSDTMSIPGDSTGGAKENGAGMPIVWNLPNAYVMETANQSPEVGHIIAPKALVFVNSGDFNGGVIGNSIYSTSEGHNWSYRGKKGTLTPTELGFTVQKRLDGSIPETDGQFTFYLDELVEGAWKNYDTKTDASGSVNFKDIEYTEDATHWYRISEETTGLPEEITADDTWYVVKVVVTKNIDEGTGDISYEEEHTVYKVIDKDNLLSGGTVNTAALEEMPPLGENPKALVADITFLNTSEYDAEGTVIIAGTKTVEDEDGDTTEERTFTFELRFKGADPASTPLDTKTVTLTDGSTADILFTARHYSLDVLEGLVTDGRAEYDESTLTWTIVYTVTERATTDKGIKPNDQSFDVTVTVTDNGDGTLSCTADPAKTGVSFVNTERDDIEVEVSGGKELTGRSLTASDKWTFILVPDPRNPEAPMPDPAYKVECPAGTAANAVCVQNTIGTFTFDNIVFTPQHLGDNNTAATYFYQVTETGTVNHVTNTTGTKSFSVTISVDETEGENKGELKAVISPENLGTVLTFTNHYYADGSVVLGALKTMNLWPSGTPSFDFTLTPLNEAAVNKFGSDPLTASATEANPTAKFSALTFTYDDVANSPFTFTVKEVVPCDAADHVCNGVTYSTVEKTVSLALTANDTTGKIDVAVTSGGTTVPLDNAIYKVGDFTNTYNTTDTTFTLKGYKQINDADGDTTEERTFTFELRYKSAAAGSAALATTDPVTVADGSTVEFSFDGITYSRESLAALVNARQATRATVNGKLTWTIPYVLTETVTTDKALKPNIQTFDVTVTVVDDGLGNLTCSASPDEAVLTFINNERNDVSISVSGGKVLTGRELTAEDKWYFAITSSTTGAPMPDPAGKVTCPAGVPAGAVCVQNNVGTFTFEDIVFTPQHLGDNATAKTYRYAVTEYGHVDNVTNTTGSKEFTVTVSVDTTTGNLKAAADPSNLGELLTFTNRYYAEGAMVLAARKLMTGNLWPTGTTSFDFKLTGTNDSAKAKIEEIAGTGVYEITAPATQANPTARFSEIDFTLEDVANSPFNFTITEVVPCDAADNVCNGVTYSTKAYNVVVTLAADETTGKVVPTVTAGGTTIPLSNAIYTVGDFTNTYTTTETTFTLAALKRVADADGDTSEERTFTFELRYASASAGSTALATAGPVSVYDGSTVEFSFAGIRYTREILTAMVNAGTASRNTVDGKLTWTIPYVLTETATTDKGIKPNTQSFPVTVTVVDDGLGKLTCTSSPAKTELLFVNNERNDVKIPISGTKSLPERALKDTDKWTFTITSSTEGAPLPDPASVQNTGSSFSFGNITFTPQHLGENNSPKTYRYSVTETGTVDHVTNTVGSKDFTVTVSVDPSTGNLTAVSDPANLGSLMTFVNHYYEDGSLVFGALKTMTGSLWPTGTTSFDFKLTPLNDAAKTKIAEAGITASATQTNPTARFSQITFTKEDLDIDPFEFMVEEVIPCDAANHVCNGVTYSTEKFIILVGLAHSETDGKIVPTVTSNGTTIPLENAIYKVGDYTNTYNTSETTFKLEASKKINDVDGDTGEERTFIFELRYPNAAAGSEPLYKTDPVTVYDGSTVEFSFPEITYNREILADLVDNDYATRGSVDGKLTWTINYVLTEKATTDKAMKPNTQSFPITVTVTDDGLGNLTCTSSPSKASLAFVNNERNDVEVEVSGGKVLTGRTITDSDKWTFTITSETDGAPLPNPASVTNTRGTFTFGNIVFTPQHLGENNSSKTYKYSVTESGTVHNVTNTTGSKDFTVTVSVDSSTGNLTAVTSPANLGEILSFVNHYYADGDVVLGARKLMTKNIWPTGTPSFDFTLTADNDAAKEKFGEDPVTASSTQANPIARFKALTFTIDDVEKAPFKFIVKEVVPADTKGVTYSEEEYEVSISLIADETTGKITPVITSDGKSIPLDNAIYTVGDFTNTYTAAETTFTLAASKQVNDVDLDTEETREFYFELRYASDGEGSDPRYTAGPVSVKDGATAEFSFEGITYTRDILTAMTDAGRATRALVDGKYTWTIPYVLTETATTDKAMKPNTQSFPVTVTVIDDGAGHLTCSSSPAKTYLAFMNNERNNVNIAVSGGKKLTGRSLTENDKWTFTISSETEGAPLPDPASVTNTFGTFTFGNITFTPQHLGEGNAEKVYTYKVTESGSVTSVTNDTEAEKTFTVRVFVDPSTGNLRAVANPANLGQLLTFTNAYHETGSVQLGALKSMNVSPWPSAVDSFTFLLKGGNAKSIAKVGEAGITASATEENPKAVFEAITFTEADMEDTDPFIFIITEVVPSETNGITYSDKSYTAEVTLSDDGLGHIIPLVTVNGETKSAENNVFTVGEFANAYKAEGSFKLEGTKEVEDKDGNMGESRTFTFTLRYKGDTASDPVMTGTVTLNDGGTADITFTPAEVKLDTDLLAELVEAGKAALDSTGEKPVWTILYTLTEDATGYADIVLNEQEIEVTVTVTDNGDGTLICEVTPAKADIAFVNEERGAAEIGINGGKELAGRGLTDDDVWTFTITSETEGAPLPDPSSVTNTLGTFSFDSIVFGFEHLNPDGSAKTYTYTVTESGSVDSVANDAEASRTFTVTVSRDANGEIQVVTDPEDLGELLTFTNTYTANGKLTLRSSKHIVDADDDKQESHTIPFELWYKADYELYRTGDTTVEPFIVEDVTIYDDGTTEFTYPLVYTLESPADPAQTPEGAIRVSLPELKEAGLATEKIVDGKSTWTVEYVLDEKTVIDQQLKPPDQTFDVVVTLTDDGAGTLEVTSVKEKNINHPEESFVEIDPEEDEFSVGQFVNKERLDSAPVVFGGVKHLEGREMTEDDTWTFTIEAVDGGPLPDPATATNKNGTFTFAPMVFSAQHLGECYYTEDGSYHCASKVYTYRVVETGKVSGVTNDEPKTFKVTVSLDENGNVQAEADPANLGELVTFTNKYEAAGDIQFTARKSFYGGSLTAGQFTFILTLPDGTTETASNDAGGLVTFSRISYTLDDAGKTYTYKVQEVIPENADPGVTYDTTVHTITVSLENDGKGNLVKTVTVDGKQVDADSVSLGEYVTFTNTYDAAADIQFTARKSFNGGNLTEGQFTFVLTLPDGTTETASNDASGLVTFRKISYILDDAGKTYTYKVQELIPENADPDIIYDTTVHTITVSLENDGRGNLVKTVTVDGKQVDADSVTISVGEFINDSNESSDEVRVRFGGTKTLKHWKKNELPRFTFLLFEDGKEIARTSTEGSGTYSFYLTYNEPGTHVYTIREEVGDNKDVIYDTREYTVTVTVTADPDGNLSAEISGDDPEKLDFVNKGRIVRTGFSAIRPTVLPDMPLDLSYKPMNLTLQIPSLELTTEIVGVPEVDGEHPVTWLGDKAGLLEDYGQRGDGRMYLAGHNHLSSTEAGPFAFLMWMEEGDRIFVTDQNSGLQLYTVYANEKIAEDDVDGLDRISMEYENSITLITCEDEYEPGHYLSRRIIAARPL